MRKGKRTGQQESAKEGQVGVEKSKIKIDRRARKVKGKRREKSRGVEKESINRK